MSAAGIYVHVPFCLTRCGYCDFNAYAGLDHLSNRYADALAREAEVVASDWRGVRFETVFVGGGTPTTLEAKTLNGVLRALRDRFEIAAGAEVTTEANPDTVDSAKLEELLAGGFTRLSMGAQSFDPAVLSALERMHHPESVRLAFAAARAAGFTNVNLDLIYGARGETLDSWRQTLDRALELGPEHLSCYALTLEPATPLGRKAAAGAIPATDPELQADMYDLACETLRRAGYLHYEVSNWARAGFECRHNLVYWRRGAYVGLGAGAHSHRDGRRWWNLRPPESYLEAVESGRVPLGGEEVLTPDEIRLEEAFLRLRTSAGVPADDADRQTVAALEAEGLLRRRGGRVVATDRGMFVANELALAFAG